MHKYKNDIIVTCTFNISIKTSVNIVLRYFTLSSLNLVKCVKVMVIITYIEEVHIAFNTYGTIKVWKCMDSMWKLYACNQVDDFNL